MELSPTSDEKIIGALLHGSVLFAFLGPIIPMVIWASQRQKSKYVRFHALQAMGYQVLTFWLWLAGMLLIGILAFVLIFPLSIVMAKSRNMEFAPFLFQIFIFAGMFGLLGLFFLVGIVGAISCLIGRDFYYPIMGKWLARRLSYDLKSEAPIDETQEDYWVSGVCHATGIIQMWGLVTPLIVWFSQKERSTRLRFQSMQALIYQLIAFIGYMIGVGLYMAAFLGMFVFLFFGGLMNNNSKEIQGPFAMVFIVFLAVLMLFWLCFMILMPLYYIFAGIAGLRVMSGHDFHYPILGRILEKRMTNSQNLLASKS